MYREVNEMPKCACCGILVPCAVVHTERHGVDLVFCSERCIRIYDEYKFPKYRDEILAGLSVTAAAE
jgi:hypothetical protein